MISKKKVESAIAQIDELVKETCEAVGLFDYDSTDLISHWKDARRKLAYCVAKILSGDATKAKEKKEIVRSYGAGSEVNEDAANDKKVIALGKSKNPVVKLYIKVKKMMAD